jgi:hypothetical protein
MPLTSLVSAPRTIAILGTLSLLQACAPAPVPQAVLPEALPVMGWDARPEADVWTESTLEALQNEGVALLSEVPGDIGTWCPGYVAAAPTERAAFWSGLLSALARHESTWNPEAVGGGGQWFGLVQISPQTAQGYGCAADSGTELKDGAANLECAVRIAAHTVLRDGVVAAGGGGLAADWGPFASAEKRAQMAAFTSTQSYCQAARPD